MFSNQRKNLMKLITEISKIEAAIKSINSRGAKLDRDIWVATVSAMAHHAKHGDVTIVNKVVASMPKGSRVNALNDFILAHGKVTYNEETKVFDHDKAGNFDLDGAQAKSWTEYKPDPEYKPLDALAMVKAMATKISKADKDKGDKVTNAQAKAILKLAADLGVEV
jgi:hypothetical protein